MATATAFAARALRELGVAPAPPSAPADEIRPVVEFQKRLTEALTAPADRSRADAVRSLATASYGRAVDAQLHQLIANHEAARGILAQLEARVVGRSAAGDQAVVILCAPSDQVIIVDTRTGKRTDSPNGGVGVLVYRETRSPAGKWQVADLRAATVASCD